MIQIISKIIQWTGKVLLKEFPVWLYIVAFVVCVLLFSVVSCTHNAKVKTLCVGTAVYQGHTYLLFNNPNYSDGSFVIVHDPDCESLDSEITN